MYINIYFKGREIQPDITPLKSIGLVPHSKFLVLSSEGIKLTVNRFPDGNTG